MSIISSYWQLTDIKIENSFEKVKLKFLFNRTILDWKELLSTWRCRIIRSDKPKPDSKIFNRF